MVDDHADGTLITDFTAEAVEQDETGVRVEGRHPDGSRSQVTGRYLIGADGARSIVRKAIGVNFECITIPEIFLSMSTHFPYHEAILELSNIAYVANPSEWLVLLHTPNLWRVLLPTDPDQSKEEMLDPDNIEQRLQAVTPSPEPFEVVHKTANRVHERVADKYWQGRIFLAGDAAHLNNPLGGMGMNGGIHDAVNLTEKLTRVWHGAPLDSMGRYQRQRRRVALETVQAQALRNCRILNETDPQKRQAYYGELRATADDPASHKAFVMSSSIIQSLRDLENVA